MEISFINDSLRFFTQFFNEGYARIFPTVNWVLARFLAIDILLFGAYVLFGRTYLSGAVLGKIIYIGAIVHLVTFWPVVVKYFADGLIEFGLLAGGGVLPMAEFLNPGTLLSHGFRIAGPLINSVFSFSLFRSPTSTLINFIFGIALLATAALMAIRIFIAVVELYAGMVMTSILLPFAFLSSTATFAQWAIGYVVASSMRLGILAFIMSAVTAVIGQVALPEDPSWAATLVALVVMVILATIVIKAPQLAGGILSGGPVLTAGSVLSTAATIGGTAASVTGGVARGAAQTATTATTVATATSTALSTGGARGLARLPASFAASTQTVGALRAASYRGQAIGAHAGGAGPAAGPASHYGTAPAWARQWASGAGSAGGTPPGPVIGNRNSQIYHDAGLPNYGDISPRNQVFFPNAAAAERAGYRAAQNAHHGQGSNVPKGYSAPYRPPNEPRR